LGSSIFFLLFTREGLDLECLSLRERKFDLRESLGGRLSGRVDKRFNMGGRGLFIEKPSLLFLGQTLTLTFFGAIFGP